MLTTPANNPREIANNPASPALNPVLATHPPSPRGRVVSSSTGTGEVSSRGREQSCRSKPSLIDRLTAEAQAARDAFGYGTLRYTDAKGTRVRVITGDVWEQIERADAHFGCKGDPVRFARALAVGRQR